MYAIVEIAGQQFKVMQDQRLFVHRLESKEGSKVSFDNVLLVDDGKKVSIGAPAITGASVEVKVVSHLKGGKVIVFKKKRRKGYRVKNGHRQALTELIVEKIQANDSKVKKSTKATTSIKDVAAKKSNLKRVPSKKVKKDFSSMTVAQLKVEAKSRQIKDLNSMKKADLLAALSKLK